MVSPGRCPRGDASDGGEDFFDDGAELFELFGGDLGEVVDDWREVFFLRGGGGGGGEREEKEKEREERGSRERFKKKTREEKKKLAPSVIGGG